MFNSTVREMSQLSASRREYRKPCGMRLFMIATVCGCATILPGCYRKTTERDSTVYAFETWVGASVLLAGLAAAPAGWAIRRSSGKSYQFAKLGFVLMGLSPLVLLVIVPGLFTDRIVVNADGFHMHSGIWLAPSDERVQFDDLIEIQRLIEEQRTRRGTRETESLVCKKKAGGEQTVPIGDLMRGAVDDILQRARARGVRVTNG